MNRISHLFAIIIKRVLLYESKPNVRIWDVNLLRPSWKEYLCYDDQRKKVN